MTPAPSARSANGRANVIGREIRTDLGEPCFRRTENIALVDQACHSPGTSNSPSLWCCARSTRRLALRFRQQSPPPRTPCRESPFMQALLTRSPTAISTSCACRAAFRSAGSGDRPASRQGAAVYRRTNGSPCCRKPARRSRARPAANCNASPLPISWWRPPSAIGATILIRGLRDGTDFDYEMQMAGMNGGMAPDIQTIFLPASPGGPPDHRHTGAADRRHGRRRFRLSCRPLSPPV